MEPSDVKQIDLGLGWLVDRDQPWESVESLWTLVFELQRRVQDLELELDILKTKPHLKTRPLKHAQTMSDPSKADASCQTQDQLTMDIEHQVNPPRRLIRCTSLKKRIFYTKVYTKKCIKGDKMEIERENDRHRTKPRQKVLKTRQRWVKIFVKKETMEIESKKAGFETPPREAKVNKAKAKKRRKETPKEWAPRGKRKKQNSTKKNLDGSGLKFDKILIQPTKVTLMTDFFGVVGKSSAIKLAPDKGA